MRNVFGQTEWCALGRLDARETDGMGAAAIVLFEVAGMFHHGKNLETIVYETKEHTDSDIVDATLLSAVHAGEAIEIVGLGSACGMELGVFDRVVGLLETDVSADALGFEFGKIFNAHRRKFDVDTTDGTAFLVLGCIAAAYCLDHVIGVVAGTFATDKQCALMTHAEKMECLGLNLVESEDFAFQSLVVATESAINTVVHTGVAGIDRSKEYEAAAVYLVLTILGSVKDLLYVGFVLDTKELGHIVKVETFELACLVEDVVKLRRCRCVVVKHSVQLVAVDEILVSHGI